MSKRKVRSAASGKVSVLVPVVGGGSRVKQEFKKEVNINTIIAKMKRGIVHPGALNFEPVYADLTKYPESLMDAFAQVDSARRAFESLPLEFRKFLDHDPKNLSHCGREEFERFGLLKQVETSGSAAKAPPAGQGFGDSDPRKGPAGANKGAKSDEKNKDEV